MASIVDKIVKLSDVPDRWGFNALIYGQSGSGKTTLCATAQDTEWGQDVLFIDMKGGIRSIVDRPELSALVPDDWKELQAIYNYLDDGKHSYKTVVVDTLTQAQRMNLQHVCAMAGKPVATLQEYLLSNNQMLLMMEAFISLSVTQGVNVLFVCQEMEERDESTGAFLIRPALTPALVKDAISAVDAVGRLVVDSKGVRKLILAPSERARGKFRQPRTGPQVPLEIEQPTLVELFNFFRKRQEVQLGESDGN